MELLSGLLSSLGLSGAAGLNAFIPLLVVGLLSRADVIQLNAPFDLLANPWVLLGVAVVGLLDFMGDKIPGVDHVLHVAGGVVNAAAGAVLFAAQSGVADVPPALSMALGLIVAGGVQATRTAVRPVATAIAEIQQRAWTDDPDLAVLTNEVSGTDAATAWSEAIMRPPMADFRVLVAVEPDEDGAAVVRGFAAIGPSEDADAEHTDAGDDARGP